MESMGTKRLASPIAWIAVALIVLAAILLGNQALARPRIRDLVQKLEVKPLPLPAAEAYSVAAWLSEDVMVLDAAVNPLDSSSWYHLLFNPETGEYEVLPLPQSDEACESEQFGISMRLPDGSFGIIHSCWTLDQIPPKDSLLRWDPTSRELVQFYRYPTGFDASEFAFNPGMTAWLQERGGDGFDDTLYYFDTNGAYVRLLPEYARAGSPAWSADGSLVAYAAIPSASNNLIGNLFSGLPGLRAAMYTPWNLYIQERIDGPPNAVLEGVVTPHMLRWSPTADVLAFRGEYSGNEGIWLIDVEGSMLVRVWPEQAHFAWAPDGTRLLINQRSLLEGPEETPVIIDVSEIDW